MKNSTNVLFRFVAVTAFFAGIFNSQGNAFASTSVTCTDETEFCAKSQIQGMVNWCENRGGCNTLCRSPFTVSWTFTPSEYDPYVGRCTISCECETTGSGGKHPSDGPWECDCGRPHTGGAMGRGYGTTSADAFIACTSGGKYSRLIRCRNRETGERIGHNY
jgi:hypothetical protein